MVMVWAFSSFIAIAATALWWLDGWLLFRVQFALNPIISCAALLVSIGSVQHPELTPPAV
jgi:hypothetical protein